MRASQTVGVLQLLRRRLPGGEALPCDWKSMKRIVGGLTGLFDEIDQCRDCGFIFYDYHNASIFHLLECPLCNASRYFLGDNGLRLSTPCYLKVNIVFQLRVLCRQPGFIASLVQAPLPQCKYSTSYMESDSFRRAVEMATSPHFDFIIFLFENTDGAQLDRSPGAWVEGSIYIG
jgi:hypothetical protein